MLRKYPTVLQEGANDCGPCCLLMIIRSYGGDYSLEKLRELTKTNLDGTTAFHLTSAANSLGFSAWTVKGRISDLKKELFPCIAHIINDQGYLHFIVINQIKGKHLIVSDPAIGVRTMMIEDFEKISTGNFILLSLVKHLPKIKENNFVSNQLKDFIYKYRNLFLSVLVISLIYTSLNIFLSYRLQLYIETVIKFYSKNNLILISLIVLLVSIIKIISDRFRFQLINYLKHELDEKLMIEAYGQIIKLPYLYYKNRSSGEIIARLQDLGEIKESISRIFVGVLVDLLLSVFAFVMLNKISSKLTAIVLITAIILVLTTLIFRPLSSYYLKSNKELSAKLNSYMIESISSVDTVKGLHLESLLENNFFKQYKKLLKESYKLNNLYSYENMLRELVYDLALVVIIFVASQLIFKGLLTLPKMITYLSLLVYFLEPIKSLIDINLSVKELMLTSSRLNHLFEVSKEELDIKNNLIIDNYDIEFKDLSYSYDGNRNVIDKLNLKIKSGSKVFISGESGSGKSTLFKLLMAYFSYEEGKIYIGQNEIANYDLRDLRENIVYVSQSEVIYNDTLYNNVTLGRVVSYEEFLSVAKMTDTLDVGKVAGANYKIEEAGFNLSGGERQRIMLARALLSKAKIYIFDESLSQLDVERERLILKNIFTNYKDSTFIVISHRKVNEDLFDEKYVLKEGRLHA